MPKEVSESVNCDNLPKSKGICDKTGLRQVRIFWQSYIFYFKNFQKSKLLS